MSLLQGSMMEADVLDDAGGAGEQPSYQRLRDLIRADIVAGNLPSGARLKIADLAARYDSSGIPVREALQHLQGEGIVLFEANRGARVRRIDEAFLGNIFEVRAVMEPFLIRWFVRHRSEAEIAELVRAQEAYDTILDGGIDQIDQHNRRFHKICYDCHPNEEAVAIAARHSALILAISHRYRRNRSRAVAAGQEHWAIIERIRVQDEDGAAAIVAEHVRNAGRDLIERMLAARRFEQRELAAAGREVSLAGP